LWRSDVGNQSLQDEGLGKIPDINSKRHCNTQPFVGHDRDPARRNRAHGFHRVVKVNELWS
jgi:hypothetical protein